MSNFITEFKKGQSGINKGLYMGKGLQSLSRHLNGIQKGMLYTIAAAPKVGKSTVVNYGFVINPWIDAMVKQIPFEIIYFSYEMNRIQMEFDFACHFLYYDYEIEFIRLDEGITRKGSNIIPLSSDYLRGRLQDDNGNNIFVKPIIEEKLKEVYYKWIIPLFGEYDDRGVLIQKGVIDFIEKKYTPSNMMDYLRQKASINGKFITETIYVPNDPERFTIVVTDTVRKIPKEKGDSIKDTIDKWAAYSVELRNYCNFTFVHIIHTNRNLADTDTLKLFKDRIFPTSESIKDSGNLSEESDYVITMFNPNDDKYNLDVHFGVDIKDKNKQSLYPDLRTLHIVESRHCEFPKHFPVEMKGGVKFFDTLVESEIGNKKKFVKI